MSLSDLLRAQEAFGINQSFLRLGTSVLPAESTLTADSARSEARLQAIGQGGLSVSPLTSLTLQFPSIQTDDLCLCRKG